MTEPGRAHSLVRAANRAKLTEPARLYLYGLTAPLIVAGLVLVAVSDTTWATVCGFVLALGGLQLGISAVRASVYSEAGHFQSLHQAASRWADITRQRA